eukprot:CAMPEP_0197433046 /NCGR_PEP_ID=MMETSP1175-20131217/1000_1 /TAXON_ID=1003142 /ORGANISM="Triceratium dubium, Strain CCMP147" /LENGTH=131 /DNA_ID=CAMNT_0042961299 /DNA_START=129 /DNA_END=524 /DNA_ORIENTATION=-
MARISHSSFVLFAPFLAVVLLAVASDFAAAFAPSSLPAFTSTRTAAVSLGSSSSRLEALPAASVFSSAESSSDLVSAATVDPTSFLSNVLGGLLGSPAILLVPVLAGISVAAVVAWFIVASASPEVEDDEY